MEVEAGLAFWGLKVTKKAQKVEIPEGMKLHLSMASLDVSAKDGRTALKTTVQDWQSEERKSHSICVLTAGKTECVNLDLFFQPEESPEFSTSGDNEIHLSGNLVAMLDDGEFDEDDFDDDMSDEDMSGSSDGEEEAPAPAPAKGKGKPETPVKVEQKKPEQKKPDQKKAEQKKAESPAKPEAKKPEQKKPEAAKPEAKKPEAKKPEAPKAEQKKPEAKKPEQKKPEQKKQPQPESDSDEEVSFGSEDDFSDDSSDETEVPVGAKRKPQQVQPAQAKKAKVEDKKKPQEKPQEKKQDAKKAGDKKDVKKEKKDSKPAAGAVKCPSCEKTFPSEEGMQQHKQAKHGKKN